MSMDCVLVVGAQVEGEGLTRACRGMAPGPRDGKRGLLCVIILYRGRCMKTREKQERRDEELKEGKKRDEVRLKS